MVKKHRFSCFITISMLFLFLSMNSVYALWTYYRLCDPTSDNIGISIKEFESKPKESIYITDIEEALKSNNVSTNSFSYSFPTNVKSTIRASQNNSAFYICRKRVTK